MITPNPKFFMSPKDRIRLMAFEHRAMSDGSHLEPRSLRPAYASVHAAIKSFYLSQGHTLAQWQIVSFNPARFNQVWWQSLGLPPDDAPPPQSMRFVLPSYAFNSSIN